MSRLPPLSWQQVTSALERAGFVFDRQKGSHMVYYHPVSHRTVVVPPAPRDKSGNTAINIEGDQSYSGGVSQIAPAGAPRYSRQLRAEGIPTMVYEASHVDKREWNESDVRDRIDSFMESLGLKRGST